MLLNVYTIYSIEFYKDLFNCVLHLQHTNVGFVFLVSYSPRKNRLAIAIIPLSIQSFSKSEFLINHAIELLEVGMVNFSLLITSHLKKTNLFHKFIRESFYLVSNFFNQDKPYLDFKKRSSQCFKSAGKVNTKDNSRLDKRQLENI